MLLECPLRLALARRIAAIIDTLCSPLLDLEGVLFFLAHHRAELLTTERTLQDHVLAHGCGLTVDRLAPRRQTPHE
jgi:hypothetical protein